jgi:hypothetical protein
VGSAIIVAGDLLENELSTLTNLGKELWTMLAKTIAGKKVLLGMFHRLAPTVGDPIAMR